MWEDPAEAHLRSQLGSALVGEPPLPDLVPGTVAAVRRGRRNRRFGAGAAGLTLCLGLAAALPTGHAPAPRPSAAAPTAGAKPAKLIDVQTAGWSVESYSNGQVTLTVRELNDPALLQKTLTKAGIPVVVFPEVSMGACGGGHFPPHFSKIIKTPLGDWMPGPLTVRRSDIPAGAEFGFVSLALVGSAGVQGATFAVVPIGTELVC